MGLETLHIRPFQPEDSLALEGHQLSQVMLGNTVLVDGEVTAYAGLILHGERNIAFFHIADNDRGRLLRERAPLFVFRVMKDSMRALQQGGIGRIHVLCDKSIARSREFLVALGFVRAGNLPWDLLSIEALAGPSAELWVSKG